MGNELKMAGLLATLILFNAFSRPLVVNARLREG